MSQIEDRVRRVLLVALAGVLVHALARLAYKAYAFLHSPYSRDYGEGCVLMMVQLLDERGSYFLPLREYPFVHGNYPPLFIALVWPFHRFFGPSLLAPRLLSTLATLGLLFVLYLLLRRLGGSRGLAVVLAGIAACPWFFQTWAPMGRVDMLALLLSIGGLLAFARGASLLVVFPLFWLAFFTKQNALIAPAAVLLHILAERNLRRAALAALGFLGPLVAILAAFNAATDGEMVRHLVTYTAAAEYEWWRLADSYMEMVRISWPLLLVIAGAVLAKPQAFGEGIGRTALLYWLLNMIALVTIAKSGAAQNYFIEPWLATVLLAGVAFPIVAARAPTPEAWRAGALLVAAACALYTSNASHRLQQAITHPERAQDFRRLWDTLRTAEGPILSENLAALVVNGKPVLVEPHGIMLLVRTGVFRPYRIVRDCEARTFGLIVAERRFEDTPGLGECLERRYGVADVLPPYRLLRPRAQ